jgi:hypothetical protein
LYDDIKGLVVPLIGIGIRTGLPNPSTQGINTRLLQGMGGLQVKAWVRGVDRTRPSYDKGRIPSDFGLSHPHDVIGQTRAPVHKLVAGLDHIDLANIAKTRDSLEHDATVLVTQDGVDTAIPSVDLENRAIEFPSNPLDFLEFRRLKLFGFGNNHKLCLFSFRSPFGKLDPIKKSKKKRMANWRKKGI